MIRGRAQLALITCTVALSFAPLFASASVVPSGDSLRSLIVNIFSRVIETFAYDTVHTLPSPEAFRRLDDGERNEIITTLATRTPIAAWEYLKEVSLVGGEVVLNAHEFAHIIGNELYKHYGVGRGAQACDPTFAYGCYHGVSEEYLRIHGPSKVVSLIRECKSFVPPKERGNPLSYSGCTHGAGHGLLTWEGLDVRSALADCDRLDTRDRPYCYDGVFMEYTFSDPAGRKNDVRAALAFCATFDEPHRIQCARNRGMYGITRENISEHARACIEILDGSARDHCIDSIGFFVGQTSKGNPGDASSMCDGIEDGKFRNRCIAAAAGEFIFQAYQGWHVNAPALCDRIEDPTAEASCHSRNESVMEQYNR